MIASVLLSLAMAQPCLKPAPHKHHAKPEPQQSCIVPMCFRDTPAPDPVELGVYPYYINTPVQDDGTQGEGPWIELTAYADGAFIVPVGGYIPPKAPTTRAPELEANSGFGALTLLACGICIARGRDAKDVGLS